MTFALMTKSAGMSYPTRDILDLILSRYLYKEDVQDIARNLNFPVSGTKDELIDKILSFEAFDPEIALAYLSKEQLRDLCDEIELSDKGTRDELFDRVLRRIEEGSSKANNQPSNLDENHTEIGTSMSGSQKRFSFSDKTNWIIAIGTILLVIIGLIELYLHR